MICILLLQIAVLLVHPDRLQTPSSRHPPHLLGLFGQNVELLFFMVWGSGLRVFTSLVTWLPYLDIINSSAPLKLQGLDVPVLLLDTEHQLRPGPVVDHLIQVLHVLLILPHGVHLLQHVLGPDNENGVNCKNVRDVTPGYESVGRLVMIPQSIQEPLGISQQLLD